MMHNNPNEESQNESFKGRGHGRRRGEGRSKTHGRRRKRGRPKVDPSIQFRWDQISGNVVVEFTILEIECLRLCDGNGQTQEEAGNNLDVSRGTIWRALSLAREKLAKAIQHGKIIEIEILSKKED